MSTNIFVNSRNLVGTYIYITIHAKVVYAIMLDLGIPKTTLLATLTKCHVP